METVEEFKFKVWLPHLRDVLPSNQNMQSNGGTKKKCSKYFCH